VLLVKACRKGGSNGLRGDRQDLGEGSVIIDVNVGARFKTVISRKSTECLRGASRGCRAEEGAATSSRRRCARSAKAHRFREARRGEGDTNTEEDADYTSKSREPPEAQGS